MITHSESIKEIMPAILAVQREVGSVSKDSTNPHFGNAYVSLNGYLHALGDPLFKNDLVMVQGPGIDGVNVTMDTILYHKSGEWIRCRAGSPMPKADPQGAGSAITYLSRYSLARLFALPQEDDDGNAASGSTPATSKWTEDGPAVPLPKPNTKMRRVPGGDFSIDDVLNFGKYKGRTWSDLLVNERGYVEWYVKSESRSQADVDRKEHLKAELDGSAGMDVNQRVAAEVEAEEADLGFTR